MLFLTKYLHNSEKSSTFAAEIQIKQQLVLFLLLYYIWNLSAII
jgi:hypothetical protein